MNDLPLRSLFISDFRRLEGHRTLPLDAPVVLIHGPNGTGKTSVLSALELALTGEIRSMRRHDPRYTAHLPFHGQEFATVRVDVAPELASSAEPITMTVAGSRIDGAAALSQESAEFFAERCFLDQVSLGQLLELYQYREGKEESALARFVNELLGLEQLDALRTGLRDATDFRNLKNLCEPIADADAEAKRANADLSRLTKELDASQVRLEFSATELREALATLGASVTTGDGESLALQAAEFLGARGQAADDSVSDLNRELTALGGRIGALGNRPSTRRLEEARAELVEASELHEQWSRNHQAAIDAWRADARASGFDVSDLTIEGLNAELGRIDRGLDQQSELAERATVQEQQLTDSRARLQAIEERLSAAQEQAGSLAEGLAAIRAEVVDDVCPVCDRNFAEASTVHLADHIDSKIAELTAQGAQLSDLRQQRDLAASEVRGLEQAILAVQADTWSADQMEGARSRRSEVARLLDRLSELLPHVVDGRERLRRTSDAQAVLEELEFLARDAENARSELAALASALGAPPLDESQSLEEAWRGLAESTRARVERQAAREAALAAARDLLAATASATEHVVAAKEAVAEAASRNAHWDEVVREARRRQGVARAVHEASSKARAAIVQRVFTESLNEVWRSVFTRLAPHEPFVPAFGIPSASKTALELTLETVHPSGTSGGSPQMMLSAGNLNTAALSLFIALHLAVEPVVPCLVFDDPVQSMDEVHVAQFAGLIRVLSKHHKRQVVIAVHERELFQYLALELSPAFNGDELLTIELGARSEDEDRGVTRHVWSADPVIAV